MKKDNVFLGLTCLLGAISITFVSLFIWKEVASHQKQPIVNYHTVNFDTDGGSFVKSQSIEDGKTISKPKDPTKIIDEIEYTFGGWYKDGTDFDFANTPITEDITLRAHWSREPIPSLPHTVHLNPSGGIIDGDDILTIYDGNTIPTAPIISREGYDSSKVIWYTTSDYQEGSEFIFGKTVVYTNLFLHAKWGDIVTNTVHFMDGNTELSTQEVDYKDYASYYKPTKQGSTFVNWYDSDDLTNTFDFETEIVGETYIYAKWDIIPVKTYTVTWVDYNGDVLKTDDNVAEGTIPSYDDDPTVVPLRESDIRCDYEFAKWIPSISEVHSNQTYVANYNVVKHYDSQVYMKINLTEESKAFEFYVTTSSSFSVDWGDGYNDTYTESGKIEHPYSVDGDYKIRVDGDVSQISLENSSMNSKLSIRKVYFGLKISSIPRLCFIGCSNLEFAEISGSVASISDCFVDCSSLKDVHILDGVTKIGDFAFMKCTSLTSINIPSSVTLIEESAFEHCSNLTTIKVNPENKTYTSRDASGNECNAIITIDGKTLIVGGNDTTIPSSVTSIGESAFRNRSNFLSIELPAGLTSLGESAFSECSSLTEIEIPNGITGIPGNCFSGCSSLVSIELPSGLTSIGNSAFQGCPFSSIELPSALNYIGDSAFYGCSSLTSINIPSEVTSISGKTFYECLSLQTVTFGVDSKLESINKDAFYKSGITSITIPSGVTSIGEAAFMECSNLNAITFEDGSKLESIDDNAFHECIKLKTIDLTALNTVPTLGNNVFDLCPDDRIIYVASEEMAEKFMSSGQGWPTEKSSYSWE